MKRVAFLLCMALTASSVSINAAEDPTKTTKKATSDDLLQGRSLFVYLLGTKGVRSPFTIERVEAMQKLSQQTDKDLLTEFKISELLLEIAMKANIHPRERVMALKSLADLYTNGYGNPNTITMLSGIAEDNKTSIPVRMSALQLIADMAKDSGGGVNTMKSFMALDDLWKKRRKLPTRMLAALVEAIGGYASVKESKKILTEAVNATQIKKSVVREGAFRGIQRWILEHPKDNSMEKIKSHVIRSIQRGETSGERVEAIRCIELMVGFDMYKLSAGSPIKNNLLEVVQKGKNIEVQAAVRVLLQIADDRIIEELLKSAKYDKNRGWTYETYRQINMALAESLITLAEKSGRSEKTVEKIFEHFKWILTPEYIKKGKDGKPAVPEALANISVKALGLWPTDFDRREVVKIIIGTLAITSKEGWKTISDECEASLNALTGNKFRTVEDAPDVERWMEWYKEKAEKFLVAKKTPYEDDE